MTNDQSDKIFHPNRRSFLGVAAATGAASLAPGALIGTTATTAALTAVKVALFKGFWRVTIAPIA